MTDLVRILRAVGIAAVAAVVSPFVLLLALLLATVALAGLWGVVTLAFVLILGALAIAMLASPVFVPLYVLYRALTGRSALHWSFRI